MMLPNLRSIYRFAMTKVNTKYVNFKIGGPEELFLDQRELEVLPGQQLMKIKAIGLNRAQCMHRQGNYKINNSVQSFLGLEAAGQVYDPNTKEKLFDGIALLSGGSYSQWASVPAAHIIPLPKNLSFAEGAAIPEAWLTAFLLLRLANLKKGDSVVVYAGASGVGTAALQLAKLFEVDVWSVVSSKEKGKICHELGANGVVYYKGNPNWAKQLLEQRGGNFTAVLDCVGLDNCNSSIQLLGTDGRWILYGLLSGAKYNINLASLMAKRISLITSTLKTRSAEYKNQLIKQFTQIAIPAFETGKLRPIIFEQLKCDWSSVNPFIQAQKHMQSNVNIGKILIEFE